MKKLGLGNFYLGYMTDSEDELEQILPHKHLYIMHP